MRVEVGACVTVCYRGSVRDRARHGACRWDIVGEPPRRVDVAIGDLLQDAATEIERLRTVAGLAREEGYRAGYADWVRESVL